MLALILTTFGLSGFGGFLIWAMCVALCAFLIGWVLSLIGVPAVAIKIVYAIAALVVILALFDAFTGPVVIR